MALVFVMLLWLPARGQEVLVDNDQGSPGYGESGTWNTGASGGYLSGTYRVASAGAASTATWTGEIPFAGEYSVYVIYRAGSNRVNSAKYTVGAPGGTQTVFVNQQTNDLTWVRLGTWTLSSGPTSVTLDAAGSSGGVVVIADAVKFVFTGGTPTPSPTPTPIPSMEEFRGLWVTGWGPGFKTPEEVTALVATVRDHHFNAILAEVRKRGDAYYFPTPPNLEPRADDIAPDFDPLQELINQAHPCGIEVHAWIVAYNVEDATTSTSPNHVVNAHPDYLMKNSAGTVHMGEEYYLDPGNPAANQWNSNVVMDLVTNYDIDGVHFDYFRYPGRDSGYNDVSIARFRAEFPEIGPPWPGQQLYPLPEDEQFKAWRRRQITDWLRAAYVDIMAVKPEMKVTAAVFATESSAYNIVLQDWKHWMGERLLDAVCPMNYSDDFATFRARAGFANSVKNGRHCYTGQAASMNSLAGTAAQMLDARALGCDGVVTFQYLATNNTGVPHGEFYDYIRDTVYAEPALLPEMPWKTHPSGGYLRGTVTSVAGGSPVYNATVAIDALTTSILTDGVGRYAFVHLPPGTYTVRAEAAGFSPRETSGVAIEPGMVSTVVFALDPGPTPTPSPTPVPVGDVIVDNDDGLPGYREAGSWTTAGSTGYNDLTYRYSPAGAGNFARWSAYLEPGEYEVSVIYRASANCNTSAKFILTTAAEDQVARIDQTRNNLVWVSLGRVPLAGGWNYVTLDAADSASGGGVVIADAVRFLKVADLPPTPTPSPSPSPTEQSAGSVWTVR